MKNKDLKLINAIDAKISIKEIKTIIDSGIDVNVQAKNGNTALYIAAFCGRLDIYNLLIENGADVNIANRKWTDINIKNYNNANELTALQRAQQKYKKNKRRHIDMPIELHNKIKKIAEHYEITKVEVITQAINQLKISINIEKDFLR